MKVNIIEVPTPMFSSFTMCAKPDFSEVIKTKSITFEVRPKTKTRLTTSFKAGQASMRINWKIPGFKQHEQSDISFLDSERYTSYYFVKSKKQDFNSYKKYLTIVVETLFNNYNIKLDEVDVLLINHKAF